MWNILRALNRKTRSLENCHQIVAAFVPAVTYQDPSDNIKLCFLHSFLAKSISFLSIYWLALEQLIQKYSFLNVDKK